MEILKKEKKTPSLLQQGLWAFVAECSPLDILLYILHPWEKLLLRIIDKFLNFRRGKN